MIWDFQDVLARRLLLWSALSMAAGALLLAFGASPWWRGFGLQALAWGAIDAAIALFGQRSARKRRAAAGRGPEVFDREAAACAGCCGSTRRWTCCTWPAGLSFC